MTAPARVAEDPPAPPPARGLESAAMACLLAALTARVFMAESGYRVSSPLPDVAAAGGYRPPDELVRATMAVVLLAAAAMWAGAQALRRQWRLHGGVFAALLAGFATVTLVGAARAPDARGAVLAWAEHLAVLAGAFVAVQLVAADRRRLGRLLAVLAALAAVMGLKALNEVLWEVPVRVEAFEADPAGQLAIAGIAAGTPEARGFETRLRDPSAIGYLGLSNVLASLLLVPAGAAAAVAIERVAAARRSARARPRRRGEAPLPALAAGAAVVLAGLGATALALTRSRGGIAAGVAGAAGAAVVAWRRKLFARRRRAALAGCAAGVAVAIAAAAVVGAVRGGLPGGRSMKVRWEYWVGSAGLIREAPLLGAGPGNFSHGYLPHRVPAAAESPKTAHNVVVDAACAFGLPGASAYLAMLGWVLAAMTRPSAGGDLAPPGGPAGREGWPRRIAFLALVVAGARAAWIGADSAPLFVLEVIIPAGLFAACLLAAAWSGDGLGAGPLVSGRTRLTLGAALAAFAGHNLVTYGLFVPATATAFWVAGGCAAGAGARAGRRLGRRAGLAAAVGALAAAVAVGVCVWRPIRRRTAAVRAAEAAWSAGDAASAEAHLRRAVAADSLDGQAAAKLARLTLAAGGGPEALDHAVEAAELAWRRMPVAVHARLLARALWVRAEPSEWVCRRRGVTGDLRRRQERLAAQLRRRPGNPVLADALAEVLTARGLHGRARAVLAGAAATEGADRVPKLHDHLGDACRRAGRPARTA